MRRLKPSAALAVWEAGYNTNGRWDSQRAVRFAEQLAAHEAKAAAEKRAHERRQRQAPASTQPARKRRSAFDGAGGLAPSKRAAQAHAS